VPHLLADAQTQRARQTNDDVDADVVPVRRCPHRRITPRKSLPQRGAAPGLQRHDGEGRHRRTATHPALERREQRAAGEVLFCRFVSFVLFCRFVSFVSS